MNTPIRAFRAPDDLWTATVTAAERTGVNASEILRRALANYEPVRKAAADDPVSEGFANA